MKQFANLLLVAITGYSQDSDRKEVSASGFDIHVVKPLNPDKIDDMLQRMSELQSRASNKKPSTEIEGPYSNSSPLGFESRPISVLVTKGQRSRCRSNKDWSPQEFKQRALRPHLVSGDRFAGRNHSIIIDSVFHSSFLLKAATETNCRHQRFTS